MDHLNIRQAAPVEQLIIVDPKRLSNRQKPLT